jgi:hypothetical protein
MRLPGKAIVGETLEQAPGRPDLVIELSQQFILHGHAA